MNPRALLIFYSYTLTEKFEVQPFGSEA